MRRSAKTPPRDYTFEMRIAVITPPSRPLASTISAAEIAVAELTRALRDLGHEVRLFPSRLASDVSSGNGIDARSVPEPYRELAHANTAARQLRHSGERYDVVHSHVPAALPFVRFVDAPAVHTIHDTDARAMREYYRDFADVGFVFTSMRAGVSAPGLESASIVHPGLDSEPYALGSGAGRYVAYLTTSGSEQAPRAAVDAARACAVPLLVCRSAIATDDCDDDLDDLETRATRPSLAFLAPKLHSRRVEVLGAARALLVPSDASDAMELGVIESLLCGTPVVATDGTVASEFVEHGVTGWIAPSNEAIASLISRCDDLDRAHIRTNAQSRWSHHRMAREYLEQYRLAAERYRAAGGRASIIAPRAFELAP